MILNPEQQIAMVGLRTFVEDSVAGALTDWTTPGNQDLSGDEMVAAMIANANNDEVPSRINPEAALAMIAMLTVMLLEERRKNHE